MKTSAAGYLEARGATIGPLSATDLDGRQAWLDASAAAVLSAGVFVFAHFHGLTNPYVINDDVRQQIYWMQQWKDPDLYRSDWLTGYARHYVPWGVQSIYWLASRLVDPLYFSKVLAGLLFTGLALILHRLGRLMGGRSLSWIIVAVFWLMPIFLDNLSGGLSRSFAAPLLALFWLSWLMRKPWLMGAALFMQALFIPYIFPLAVGSVLLAHGAKIAGWRESPPFLTKPAHFAVVAVSGTLLLLWYMSLSTSGYGPMVSYADMLGHPEFTEKGRYAILPVPSLLWELVAEPWEYIAYLRSGKIAAGVLACILLGGGAAFGAFRADWASVRHRLQPALYLGAASLILYVVARVLLLRLFIPGRYLTYTVNLFYCLGFALCIQGLTRGRAVPKALVAAILVLALGLAGVRLKGVGIYDYSADRALYAEVEKTPKDALIAGPPGLMDTVLTFGHRRAFATYELAHPWSKGLWGKLRPRLDDLFAAYYSEDPKEVLAFTRKYRIDFLVVDDRYFDPELLAIRPPFFAPFDETIRSMVKDRKHFALLSDQVFHPIHINDHQRLLDMRSLN